MSDESRFKHFAKSVELNIEKYGHGKYHEIEDITPIQKAQVDKLIGLETEFRKELIKHRNGPKAYRNFVTFICDEKKNILFARPYFRHRKEDFRTGITQALEKRHWRGLLKYRINYLFVLFVLKTVPWSPKSKIVQLAEQIRLARIELIEFNLPLAISRARMFWSKTPKAHLEFFDFIQLAADGFMAGVDKFEPPYDNIFRSVLIQRASGNMIEAYSQTMLHFYPSDKRKIYRINKFQSRHPHGAFEIQSLVDSVNVGEANAKKHTSASEVAELQSATSIISADTKAPDGVNVPSSIAKYEAPAEDRPDTNYERRDALTKMHRIISTLPLIDQKLLRLKGIATEV